MPFLGESSIREGASGAGDVYVPAGAAWTDGSADYWTLDPGAGDSVYKGTWSFWLKPHEITAENRNLLDFTGTANNNWEALVLASDHKLIFYWGAYVVLKTTAQLRDPTAFYHIVLQVDMTQATAADRANIWINGVKQTAFDTETYPAQNTAGTFYNSAGTRFVIGSDCISHSATINFGATWADFIYLDNYSNVASAAGDFGEFDAKGNWVPVDPTSVVTANKGTNGFWLDFADSANLGNDVSGNNNHFTATSMSSANATNDNPADYATNGFGNFCVLNPLNKNSNVTLSNANLLMENDASAAFQPALGTIAVSSGVYRWSVKITGGSPYSGYECFGVAGDGLSFNSITSRGAAGTCVFDYQSGTSTLRVFNESGTDASYATSISLSAGDEIVVLLDADNQTIELRTGNTSHGTVDISGIAAPYIPLGMIYSGGTVDMAFNFGQSAFTQTLDGSEVTLDTANLPAPTVTDPTQGFVQAEDTETDIAATLGALRSGWSSYFEFLVNLSNVETRICRFSHDISNEHALGSTDTYQAARTLSGSDTWYGFALKIDSAYGTAAGAQSHTNGGGDTTVTHSLGNATCGILLFPRANGDVYFYHPDLTSGKLLKLNGFADQAASTRIKNVGANSFDIESAAPSDTYDYLVVTSVSGFCSIGNYTGNASSDGPVYYQPDGGSGFRSACHISRRLGANEYTTLVNVLGNPYNVASKVVDIGTDGAEGTDSGIDINSNNIKPRSATNRFNWSNVYICIDFAEYPFGGSGVAQAKAR